MKIARIETIPIEVPIRPRIMIRGSKSAHAISPFLIVKVHTDEGIIGLGEVSATPRWSGEDHTSAAHFIQTYIAPALFGENPADIEGLTRKIGQAVAANPFTKAALEMALWDIAGKAAGAPVYQLLGGKVREHVPLKWSVSGVEPAPAAEIALWAVNQGFRTMKVKVGNEADVERVRAVRNAIGPDIRLGVDANGAWEPEVAVEKIRRMQEYSIYFAEQPVPAPDIAGLADVRSKAGIPIVADESVYSLDDARRLVRAHAADVFSVYVGKAAGIGPARKIAAVAEAANLGCTIGSNLEMGIGSAAMIHLALATKAVTADEYPCDIIGPLFYEEDLLQEPLLISRGQARPHECPGLGVALDDDKVEHYRVK